MTITHRQPAKNPSKRVFAAITLLLSLVAFLIYTKDLPQLELLYCSSDEMGYLGTAAYFAGVDWTGVVSHLYYYSYGYSLLLAPLFSITTNPVTLYQLALALNAVMMAATIPISYQVGKRLFPHTNRLLILIVSFVVALYAPAILQVTMARNESLLFLIVWALLLLFLLMDEQRGVWPVVCISILSFYAFMVHQRAIAIWMGAAFVILLLWIKKKIALKHFIAFWVAFGGMLVLHLLLKNDVQSHVWTGEAIAGNNDFSGVASKLKILFTTEGAANFLKALLGQMFYLGAASFLIYYVGAAWLGKQAAGTLRQALPLKKRLPSSTDDQQTKEIPARSWAILFLMVSVILTMLLSAFFLLKLVRMDHVLYGRYNDVLAGPVLLFALLELLQQKKPTAKLAMGSIAIFIAFGVVSYFSIQGLPNFSIISSPAMAWLEPYFAQQWYLVILLPVVAFAAIVLLTYRNFRFARVRGSLALGLTAALFLYTGFYPIMHTMLPGQHQNQQATELPVQYIEQHNPTSVYGYGEGEDAWQFSYLQHALGARPLHMLGTAEDVTELPMDSLVITTASGLFEPSIQKHAQIIDTSNRYILWETGAANQESDAIEIPLKLFSSQAGACSQGSGIQSSGEGGFLLYGPYLHVPAGSYTAVVHVSTEDALAGTVGTADVAAYGQPIATADVIFGSNTQTLAVRIPFTLAEATDMLEIRLQVQPGLSLTVTDVFLEHGNS